MNQVPNSIFIFGDYVTHLPTGLVGTIAGYSGGEDDAPSLIIAPVGNDIAFGHKYAQFLEKVGAGFIQDVSLADVSLWPGPNDFPPSTGAYAFMSAWRIANIARMQK